MNPKIIVDLEGVEDRMLTQQAQAISDFSVNELGLSYPDIRYHIVDVKTIAEVSAAHGSPVAPQTWQLEQNSVYLYERQKSMGVGIYEIVNCTIGPQNSEGKYIEHIDAFIADTDAPFMKKLVTSHVTGHAHVAANNLLSKRVKEAAGYYSPHSATVELAELVGELYKRFGIEPVSDILDAVEVIAGMAPLDPGIRLPEVNTVDDLSGFHSRRTLSRKNDIWEEMLDPVEKRARAMLEERKSKKQFPLARIDNVREIIEQSEALETWQKYLVSKAGRMFEYRTRLVAPVKVLHEGFSTMIEMLFGAARPDIISEGELLEYVKSATNAMRHSRTSLNPYGLGFDLLNNVMRQWSDGEFGLDFDREKNTLKRIGWSNNHDLRRGWEKVLEIAANYSDLDLMARHFDMDFFQRNASSFYTFDVSQHSWSWWSGHNTISRAIIASREFDSVKNALLLSYLNSGRPYFHVLPGEADYKSRGELMVTHEVDPLPSLFNFPRERFTLESKGVENMLSALCFLWKRPVHVRTVDERGQDLYITCRMDNNAYVFSEHFRESEL